MGLTSDTDEKEIGEWGRPRTTARQTTTAMLGLIHGSGSPPESRGWPHSVLWRLGGFFFLLLLEGAGCLANPSSTSGVNNNNNHPSVNIYMSVEEVKKLLGKKKARTQSLQTFKSVYL